MLEATYNIKYLGLPNTMGRNKNAILGFLKDMVRSRIMCWDGKIVSKGGKEILLKTIFQALPTYAMGVVLLLITMCKEIEQFICNYWWNSDSNTRKGIHWASWERMCEPKSNGGMGFRSLHDFNIALLGKQAWRLLNQEELLVSKVFKARYFPRCSFIEADLGSNPSFIWRSILASQSLIKAGVRWRIGSGDKIIILDDVWLPDSTNPFVISIHPGLADQKVNSLMKKGFQEWDLKVNRDMFVFRDQNQIYGIPLRSNHEADVRFGGRNEVGFTRLKVLII